VLKRMILAALAVMLLACTVSAALAAESYSAHTPVSGADSNKLNNLRLAAQAIDGLEIPAGNSFSFNKVVGPREKRRGYRKALNGRGVEVTGGGVAQVASTLYMALLDMGRNVDIDPVKTYGNRFTDDYVQNPSLAVVTDYDADIDLSFTNLSDDMVIDMWLDDDNLWCVISVGQQSGLAVSESGKSDKTTGDPYDEGSLDFLDDYGKYDKDDSDLITDDDDPYDSGLITDDDDPYGTDLITDDDDPYDTGLITDDDDPYDSGLITDDDDPYDSGLITDDDDPYDSGLITDDDDPYGTDLITDDDDPYDTGLITDDDDPDDSGLITDDDDPYDSGLITDDNDPYGTGLMTDDRDWKSRDPDTLANDDKYYYAPGLMTEEDDYYTTDYLSDSTVATGTTDSRQGSARLYCGGDKDVLHNVSIAADCLSDTVLDSGASFSFNDVVGPRTQKYGYRRAINGRGAKVIGGGVAQVASALWLAVKDNGNVDILEKSTYGARYNQRYVDDEDDAILTDYASGKDFRFRYVGKRNLVIYTYVQDGWLYCDVYED